MHNPKISVIVPTYNRDRVLCDTLEFVLKQDYENYEIVVVDQSERHDEYTEQYLRSNVGRIRHLRFGPPNLPAARNYGIHNTTGDVVLFSDDDMVLPTDALSSLAVAYSYPDTWGATGFVINPRMTEEEKVASYSAYAENHQFLCRGDAFIELRECMGALMSFRRELFHRIGYFDEWLGTQLMGAGEDGEFTRRMTLRGYSLRLMTGLTAIHLGVKHGGCGRRSLNPEVVDRAQLRVATYCCLKNRRYPRFVGWADAMWRCYRFFALNRAALCAHPAIILRRHIWFLSILPEMARMVRHNSVHENDASLGNDEIGTLVPKGSAN